jgi:hypothetical protein
MTAIGWNEREGEIMQRKACCSPQRARRTQRETKTHHRETETRRRSKPSQPQRPQKPQRRLWVVESDLEFARKNTISKHLVVQGRGFAMLRRVPSPTCAFGKLGYSRLQPVMSFDLLAELFDSLFGVSPRIVVELERCVTQFSLQFLIAAPSVPVQLAIG